MADENKVFNTEAGETVARELEISFLNTGTKAAPVWSPTIGTLDNMSGPAFERFATKVQTMVKNVFSWLSYMQNAGASVSKILSLSFDNVAFKAQGMAQDVISGIRQMIAVMSYLQNAGTETSKIMSLSFNDITGRMRIMVQSVVSGVHEMIAALEGLRNVGGIFSQTLPTPKMASGTILPQSREFLSAISVQSSGTEGVSEDTIRRIVREETGGSTELLRAILEAVRAGHVIEVDRRVLGKTVTQEQNRMTRSSGRSALLT